MPDFHKRPWEGPHRTLGAVKIGGLKLIQIGWWLEPEAWFIPHWMPLHITGSATPVYIEDSDD